MKISIIIPTYKPKDYLWECLDSIVVQSFSKKDFELILVLNGCCEPWKTDIEKYIASKMIGMNIKFIQLDEGGVSNARNVALDIVEGEYITFIDDDDYISPSFLDDLYNAVTPDTISVCNTMAFWEGESGFVDFPLTNVYKELAVKGVTTTSSKVRKFFSGPCMKLIPMSFIQGRKFDVRFKNGEDSIFMFLISDKFKRVSFSAPTAIYYRRFREGSAVTSHRSRYDIILNGLKMMSVYCGIYFRHPWRYSFNFFITRILGACHGILVGVERKLN